MGVFLHSSEHWLVVMDSVMTEILWSSQISISTVSHRPHLDSLHHPGLLSTFFISTSSSPPHNGRLLSRLNLPKNSVVFLSLGQKGANENLLCFNYVFWPAVCPVVDGQHKNICYTSIPQSRPQHTWRQANVINIRRAATSWWTGEWAVSSQYCVMMGSAGTIYHQERDDLDIGGSAHWRAVTIQSRHL